MAIILRIDVDRPFGKRDFVHKAFSRIASESYFPRIEAFHYLDDLKFMLDMLNSMKIRSYIFFRKCTLPSRSVLSLIEDGGHVCGLHLEDSRSYETFLGELRYMEAKTHNVIRTFSKHGSGLHKYGMHHYPPYEPDRYIEWAKMMNMKVFFGNLQDPSIPSYASGNLLVFPSAFWLEHCWRNTDKFDVAWLCHEAQERNVVLLFHPDNVTASPALMAELDMILSGAGPTILV